jgi:short-chain Z-isoprenyl diphosphate synthase
MRFPNALTRMRHPLYRVYERRLTASLPRHALPKHVGVILDGNRRWARAAGRTIAGGHQQGADHIAAFLGWAEEMDVQVVTIWLLSTDNLSRSEQELADLLPIITDAVQSLADSRHWRLRIVGTLGLLPEGTREELLKAAETTVDCTGMVVNIAVGYGGRDEIADAVRSLLRARAAEGKTLTEVAETLSTSDIADHLYTTGQPDPELLIRTSGEQRLGGFLLWQSAHSEFYFCEAYWPDFRRVDFLRALRSYTQRERRLGR